MQAIMINDVEEEEIKRPSFSWAKGKVLTQSDFNIEDKVAYVTDFIFSGSITLIYSPPKQGKTWLGYGVAMELGNIESIKEVYYLDMDNSISTLKERNLHETLMQRENIHYMTRGTIGCDPLDLLSQIALAALRDAYANTVFFLDTTKDFVDTDNKGQSVQFMKYCVRLRDAGATVVILHHATKNKRTISGNPVFTNSPDNVYEMKQTGKMESVINYELKVTHARGLVKDCRWSVDTSTLTLMAYDALTSGITDEEKKAVAVGVAVLKNSPDGLSASKLIEAMGFERTNRTGKRLVKELIGKYWSVDKKSANNHKYHTLKEVEK